MQEKENKEVNLQVKQLQHLQPKQSIQDAFKKFQKEKFYQLKLNKYLKQTNIDRSSPEYKAQLRHKFVETAKKYIGIPYAKKYHKPGDKHYDSPLFLDCCAYIRQVVFDMRLDFGFTLGKWNQAYQFDLLPDQHFTQQNLKPGDIIFYSAYYYDKRIKPFPHDIVHVEIYMGQGKSLGARWQKGGIQLFDSYKFKSNLYYDIKYHFRSIDAWLQGKCQSYCNEHKWLDERANQWLSEKFSVFADPTLDDLKIVEKEIQGPKNIFIGKGGNLNLIRTIFSDIEKYHIMPDKQKFSTHYFLKWVQSSSQIDYYSFKQGKQLVNHIPNMVLLTSKIELLKTLKQYTNALEQAKQSYEIHMDQFIPKTYRLDVMSDEIQFLNDKTQGIWIYKPRNQNQGKGIHLINDIQVFKAQFLQSKKFYLGQFSLNNMLYYKPELDPTTFTSEEHKYSQLKHNGLIQHYLRPYLLNGYKFDIRCYMLIHTTPQFVLFNKGYLRLTLEKYNQVNIEDPERLFVHLTNNCFQRKHKDWKTRYQDSIGSWDMLYEQLPKSKVDEILSKIKKILLYTYSAAAKKIEKKKGYFELLGCDVILNQNLQPYLLEINTNPALFLDTKIQQDVIPKVVESTIRIALENFNNPDDSISILNKQEIFQPLYIQSKKYCYSDNTSQGYLTEIFKAQGQEVKIGDLIAHLRINSLTQAVHSRYEGKLHIKASIGNKVTIEQIQKMVEI